MSDWVVETPSFEEDLMNDRVVMLNQVGVNRVVEIIKEKDKEIERLNNIINELEKELREDYKIWMCKARENGRSVQFGIDVCKTHFYNRLQELKGE